MEGFNRPASPVVVSHQAPVWCEGTAATPTGSSAAHSRSAPGSLHPETPAPPWKTSTGPSWSRRPAETSRGAARWRERRRRRRRKRKRRGESSSRPSKPSAPAQTVREEEEQRGRHEKIKLGADTAETSRGQCDVRRHSPEFIHSCSNQGRDTMEDRPG